MKGTIVFYILAAFSFVNIFVGLSTAYYTGLAGYVAAIIASLQMVAWIMIGWMWETLMN